MYIVGEYGYIRLYNVSRREKMKNTFVKTENKNVVIGALVIAILIMAIGYALLSQELKVNGSGTISSTWNVGITNIVQSAKEQNATERTEPSFTSTTATFDVGLTAPGDSMTYDITISNTGSLDAKVSSIIVTPSDESAGITYTVTGVQAGTTLAAGETNTVHVKVSWDNTTGMPAVLTKTVSVTVNYEQDI
jgi:hypothetical protein